LRVDLSRADITDSRRLAVDLHADAVERNGKSIADEVRSLPGPRDRRQIRPEYREPGPGEMVARKLAASTTPPVATVGGGPALSIPKTANAGAIS
jgi:hypothetical protein